VQFNPKLEPFLVDVNALELDPSNERKHDERNLASIKGSLQKFGQQTPIVFDPDSRTILKGNGTFMAIRELGWEKIAALPTNLIQSTDKTGYRIADNRTSELATWDMDALEFNLKALKDDGFDLKDIGFDDSMMDDMFGEWKSDFSSIEKTEENLDGITSTIKILVPQEEKDEVKDWIVGLLQQSDFQGVSVE
jgi:site-specific DNA-methyltransferase (adenine-specific)